MKWLLLFYAFIHYKQFTSHSSLCSSLLSGGGRVTQWLKWRSRPSVRIKIIWGTHLPTDCKAAFRNLQHCRFHLSLFVMAFLAFTHRPPRKSAMLTQFTENASAADVVLTRLASSSWEEASQEVVYDEQGERLFTCYLVLGVTEQRLSNFSVRPSYLQTVLWQQCASFGLQISVFSLICHFKKLQYDHKLNLVLGYMK